MTHLPPRHLAFLVLINLLWGFNLIASKLGAAEFPPMFFTALRFTLLALCLTPFLRWHRGMMQQLLIAAALSGGVQFALLFMGVKLTPEVGSVAIATQLGVPFTTLIWCSCRRPDTRFACLARTRCPACPRGPGR